MDQGDIKEGVGEGATSFPGLLHFNLNPYLIILKVEQGAIKYHFLSFIMTLPVIEPRSPRPLANTLPTGLMFLPTVVEGDQKALFSIATIPRCRRGRYSFPWTAPLYP